jgi:hypothetical protein
MLQNKYLLVDREDQAAKQFLTIWTDPADVAKSSILHQFFVFSLAFCPHFSWSLSQYLMVCR